MNRKQQKQCSKKFNRIRKLNESKKACSRTLNRYSNRKNFNFIKKHKPSKNEYLKLRKGVVLVKNSSIKNINRKKV